jgi:hypothetical protein
MWQIEIVVEYDNKIGVFVFIASIFLFESCENISGVKKQ